MKHFLPALFLSAVMMLVSFNAFASEIATCTDIYNKAQAYSYNGLPTVVDESDLEEAMTEVVGLWDRYRAWECQENILDIKRELENHLRLQASGLGYENLAKNFSLDMSPHEFAIAWFQKNHGKTLRFEFGLTAYQTNLHNLESNGVSTLFSGTFGINFHGFRAGISANKSSDLHEVAYGGYVGIDKKKKHIYAEVAYTLWKIEQTESKEEHQVNTIKNDLSATQVTGILMYQAGGPSNWMLGLAYLDISSKQYSDNTKTLMLATGWNSENWRIIVAAGSSSTFVGLTGKF